jgi:hypothetical protein
VLFLRFLSFSYLVHILHVLYLIFSDAAAVKIEDLQEKVVYYKKVVQKEEVSTQSFLYSPLFTHAVEGNFTYFHFEQKAL